MIDPAVALAFTAGMLATFNPCGFSLLPAYVAAFVAGDDAAERLDRRIGRAAGAAAAMALAFVVVFSLVGLVVGTLAEEVSRRLPWITIAVGALLVAAGLAMVIGWKPAVALPGLDLKRRGGRATAMTMYGATFAVASLSCTIGPFLAVTGTVIDRPTGEVVASYVAYALGMGAMVLAISLAVAFAHTALVGRMRRMTAQVTRVGGALMILAGIYVIWYARWELAVFGGDVEANPLVDAGERIRTDLVSFVEGVGTGRIAAVTLMVVAAIVALERARRRRAGGAAGSDGAGAEEYEAVS